MTEQPQLLSVLREPAWGALAEALEEAVTQEGALPAAREVLLRPARLLELFARDALPALGDDVGAAERLRLLLHLAAPFRGVVDDVRKLTPKRAEWAARYEPGLLDHGAMAVVALAALRVQPSEGARSLEALHGLALAAAPAEALARLIRLHAPDGLSTVVGALYLLDTVGTALKTPFVRPFAEDPAERGRWSALARLFDEVLPEAIAQARRAAALGKLEPLPWDGATARPVERLEPVEAAPGEPITLLGSFDDLSKGGRLRAGVRVVLASDEGVRPVQVLGGKGGVLRVRLPEGAGPGWIGFSSDEAIADSNRFRRALQAALSDAAGPGLSIPAEATIPLLQRPDPERQGRFLAAPPRTATNRFGGQLPRIVSASILPRGVGPRGVLTITWRTRGADAVRLEPDGVRLPPSGRHVPITPTSGGPPAFELIPLAGPEGAETSGQPVRLEAEPSVQPLRPISLVVIRPCVVEPIGPLPARRGVRAAPAAPAPGSGAPSNWRDHVRPSYRFSPVLDSAGLELVLASGSDPGDVEVSAARITPAADAKAVARAVAAAGGAAGLEPEVVEPPYVDDALAALLGPVTSGDDPRIPELLDLLARRALLTPGFEHALWVCVVPAPPAASGVVTVGVAHPRPEPRAGGEQGFFRSAPAAGAQAVAVCDLAGLAPLLRDQLARPLPAHESASRLRILGTLRDVLDVESVQEEVRAAGPGAPCEGPLRVVTLDAAGRAVADVPLRLQREGRGAIVAALVPVASEVVAVEIRRGGELARRFERSQRGPTLGAARLTASPWAAADQHLAFSYDGARPLVALALLRGGMRTEVQELSGGETSPAVHLTRYRAADAVELWASDGWTSTNREVEPAAGDQGPLRIDNATPVLIRRLAADRYWADAPPGWAARWTVDGGLAREGALIRISPRVKGVLRLQAAPAEGAGLHDEVWLEPEVR